MGTIVSYIGYHSTDKKNIRSIRKEGFSFNPNPKHWLGDGVYFFSDNALAKKWAIRPPKGYGRIYFPVVLKAKITSDKDSVIDMRMLDHYNYIKQQYDLYVSFINNASLIVENTNIDNQRCAFFNWLQKKLKMKVLIAYFDERNLSEATSNNSSFIMFHMPYIETQICVYDNTCIRVINYISFIHKKWSGENGF